MADVISQIREAVELTGPIVDGVADSQWDRPTLCEEFNARQLVNHMVGAATMFRDVIEKGAAQAGQDTDHLGSDPKASWHAAMKSAVEAFEKGDVLGRTLNMPFGEFPGAAAAGIFLSEVFVHGVDLAVATDQEDKVDQAMSVQVTEGAKAIGIDNFRMPGVFGQAVEVPAGSAAHRVMLGYFGRNVA